MKGEGCLGTIVFFGFIVLFVLAAFFRLPMNGDHVGYITAVDQGVFCTKVYVKTDLSSSQEDIYEVANNSAAMSLLKEARDNKSNVKLTYKAAQASWCSRDIYNVETISNEK